MQSTEANDPLDERFHEVLAAYDDAGRAGDFSVLESEPTSLRDRVERAREVLGLLKSSRQSTLDEILSQTPISIGGYRIERVLGFGAFGIVYLAHHEMLHQLRAIKVPHRKLVQSTKDGDALQEEARTIAKLRHPNIVEVYDAGSTPDCACFIVCQFVEGATLAKKFKNGRPAAPEAVALIATLADALQYAHQSGVVHRDVKPGNILIDLNGKPYITDFGLALLHENVGRGPRFLGTPAYMSPEQARGEGHRVDGRSDIFSLGIIFYELLTGHPPFHADSRSGLLDQITTYDPRPPRQWDGAIPRELERICLKALSKRVDDRYASARDMVDDLRYFQEHSTREPSPTAPAAAEAAVAHAGTSPVQKPPVVPKGLRSFDAHDASFFMDLLPGPRDRDGLPESVRFWKNRIESQDPEGSFSVGLIYGPSGCGKSSLMKAGVLPRLSPEIVAIYIEATAEDTEMKARSALKRRFPELQPDLTLKESLAVIRSGRLLPAGQKVLLVLDQFEQYLHLQKDQERSELVQALRQCNGRTVQCLIMVRDDFWMAATRFMRALEIRLVEGRNSAAVDLFPVKHAENVLAEFGRAFQALPENLGDTTKDQRSFLERAAKALAQDDKVMCVRLALFAEMVKDKPWTPSTLKAIGGAEGAGVTFLEETFSSSNAPPGHRLHQRAARAVLQALLPPPGSDIKGRMEPVERLRELTGYADRHKDFDDLIEILDHELRLISSIDPEGQDESGTAPSQQRGPVVSAIPASLLDVPPPSLRYYQLTHDFLVPAIREWLTGKEKETPEGRARLLLAERATLWIRKTENKQLPSFLEWLTFVRRTERSRWTDGESRMMRAASRRNFTRIGIFFVSLASLALFCVGLYGAWHQQRRKEHADQLVKQLLLAQLPLVSSIADQLNGLPGHWHSQLADIADNVEERPGRRLRAHLALAADHPGAPAFLVRNLLEGPLIDLPIIVPALKQRQAESRDFLWLAAQERSLAPDQLLRVAFALAEVDSNGQGWPGIAHETAAALVRANFLDAPFWTNGLRPARKQLLEPLAGEFYAANLPEAFRVGAGRVLADYAGDDPKLLVSLLCAADSAQLRELLPAIKAKPEPCIQLLTPILDAPIQTLGPDLGQRTRARANCSAALLLLDRPDAVRQWLGQNKEPDVRSALIDLLPKLIEPEVLWSLRSGPMNDVGLQALVMAMENFISSDKITGTKRTEFEIQLRDLYTQHESAAVHSAAEWLLRTLNNSHGRAKPLEIPVGVQRDGWRVSELGHTMALIRTPGNFVMGSPMDGERRDNDVENLTPTHISYSYEIATHEVTVVQFLALFPNQKYADDASPTKDCPISRISWYDAARFCRKLSELEHIAEDQMVFPKIEDIVPERDLVLPKNWQERTGYRLPTEAEWEFACRAGTSTRRFFGASNDNEALSKYGWWIVNSEERCRPVGLLRPNPFGLFDILGNVGEWCMDRMGPVPQGDDVELGPVKPNENRTVRGGDYQSMPKDLRSAKREIGRPGMPFSQNGFRIVRRIPNQAPDSSKGTP